MHSPDIPQICQHQLRAIGQKLRVSRLRHAARHLPTERLQHLGRRLPAEHLQHLGRRARGSIVVLLLLLVSAVPSAMSGDSNPRPTTEAGDATEAAGRALAARAEAATTASRSLPRTSLPADELGAAPQPQAEAPEQKPEPKEDKAEQKNEQEVKTENTQNDQQQEGSTLQAPAPIADLNQRQMEHATTIVQVGQDLGLPQQAYVVALATALQESYLRVLASPVYPESSYLPHDGVGYDHDSVGIFQQRPSSGWGTVAECMDPASSARSFYAVLQQTPGWQDLPITVAAQAVQVSAFPDHYAQHEPLARELVNMITHQ